MIIIVELATIWAHLATPKALALDLNGNRHIFHYFMRFFDISSDDFMRFFDISSHQLGRCAGNCRDFPFRFALMAVCVYVMNNPND